MDFIGVNFLKHFWKEVNKYLLLGLIITIIATAFFAHVSYKRSFSEFKDSLTSRIELISKVVRPEELGVLNANPEDQSLQQYKDLKFKLESIRSVVPDIRFIYLLTLQEGELYFLIDSEPEYSPDMSPPGQHYEEAPVYIKEHFVSQNSAFTGGTFVTPAYKDRWGEWISVYLPIKKISGEIVLVGADVDYKQTISSIRREIATIILVGSIIILFFLGALYIQYREKQVLNMKTTFISLASHELRAPLTGIKWSVENMLRKGGLSDTNDKTLNTILVSTENVVTVVNDFLNYVNVDKKIKQNELSVFAPGILIEKSIETLSSLAQNRNINIKYLNKIKAYSQIKGDSPKVQSAFNNVISNAIKYSKDGGVVEIVYDETIKNGKCWIEIQIKDHGIGIPKSEQKKVFAGMYRTEKSKKHTASGTGLGLYFAKHTILEHKGSIALSSKEDFGTTVSVSLPALSVEKNV